jgi:hypothetical protein
VHGKAKRGGRAGRSGSGERDNLVVSYSWWVGVVGLASVFVSIDDRLVRQSARRCVALRSKCSQQSGTLFDPCSFGGLVLLRTESDSASVL